MLGSESYLNFVKKSSGVPGELTGFNWHLLQKMREKNLPHYQQQALSNNLKSEHDFALRSMTAICHSTDAQVKTVNFCDSPLCSKTTYISKLYTSQSQRWSSAFRVRCHCLCFNKPETAVCAVFYHNGHISKREFLSSEGT